MSSVVLADTLTQVNVVIKKKRRNKYMKLNKEEMNTKQIDNEKNVIEKLGNKALRKANY